MEESLSKNWLRLFFRLLFKLLTGEIILDYNPNGGGVVLARAIWSSLLVFSLSMALHECLRPDAIWGTWSSDRFFSVIQNHLTWFGGILVAIYAALYARFSSQWTYLANLYNLITSTAIYLNKNELRAEQRMWLATWWAAFIEDAQDLHLATKKNYALLILYRLQNPEIRKICKEWTIEGPGRIEKLERRLQKAIPDADYERVRHYCRKYGAEM